MKLACHGHEGGWRTHDLGGPENISARIIDDRLLSYHRREGGRVILNWVKDRIRLNGQYQFSMTVTRNEAARLFAAAFKDATLDECIEAIKVARNK